MDQYSYCLELYNGLYSRVKAYLMRISGYGIKMCATIKPRHSQPSDDSFVLGLIVRDREAECEGLFDDKTLEGGEDESDVFPFAVRGSVDIENHPSRESLCVAATRVNSTMKSARTCPLIIVLGSYLMSYEFSSAAHFAIHPVTS